MTYPSFAPAPQSNSECVWSSAPDQACILVTRFRAKDGTVVCPSLWVRVPLFSPGRTISAPAADGTTGLWAVLPLADHTTSAATWIGETTVVRAIAHALPMIKEIQEWIRLCDVAELRAARIWNGVGAFAV